MFGVSILKVFQSFLLRITLAVNQSIRENELSYSTVHYSLFQLLSVNTLVYSGKDIAYVFGKKKDAPRSDNTVFLSADALLISTAETTADSSNPPSTTGRE